MTVTNVLTHNNVFILYIYIYILEYLLSIKLHIYVGILLVSILD